MSAMQLNLELPEKHRDIETPLDASIDSRPWQPSTHYQKIISAGTGAILTSLLVTPFDVVKTRMQSSHAVVPNAESADARARRPRSQLALTVEAGTKPPHTASTTDPIRGFASSRDAVRTAATSAQISGTWDGIVKIARQEGILALWRGLSPTLVMSVPSTVIYYIGYEHIRDAFALHLHFDKEAVYSPLLAGATARTLAATAISPIELVRTRMQSTELPLTLTTTFRNVRSMVVTEGYTSLWRGLAPTLWRDVPFSAIYWIGYEGIKARLQKRERPVLFDTSSPTVAEFQTAFVAGAASGTVAAIVTTPFDVAKTLEQISSGAGSRMGMVDIMKGIVKRDGWMGLFSGLSPRVAKVAPACAVMISSYEVGKRFFENSNAEQRLVANR